MYIDLEIVTICKCIAKKFKDTLQKIINLMNQDKLYYNGYIQSENEKNHFKKNIDLFFYYFDKGSKDAILNISMEMQPHLVFI